LLVKLGTLYLKLEALHLKIEALRLLVQKKRCSRRETRAERQRDRRHVTAPRVVGSTEEPGHSSNFANLTPCAGTASAARVGGAATRGRDRRNSPVRARRRHSPQLASGARARDYFPSPGTSLAGEA